MIQERMKILKNLNKKTKGKCIKLLHILSGLIYLRLIEIDDIYQWSGQKGSSAWSGRDADVQGSLPRWASLSERTIWRSLGAHHSLVWHD